MAAFGAIGSNMSISSLLTRSCLLLASMLAGCAMDGHRQLTVIDPATNQISGILVVPLYYVSGGVGVGPDGKGLHSASKPVVMKPFTFNSGDDLMAKKVPTKGVIVPPLPFYAGSTRMVYRWLFLKQGHSPLVVDQGGVWADKPLVMTTSVVDQVTPCIDVLLATAPEQQALTVILDARHVTETVSVLLDTNDTALLRKYRSQP